MHSGTEDAHVHAAAARGRTGKDPLPLLTEKRRSSATTIYILFSLLFLAADLGGED